ncbi:hypothetical protein AB0L05_34520 [Nonomuraea pusilla]|uniref:hypothetical protein n=1 Tax=Nonomuraea pusilla TaxID=46177 RepID=UPI00332FB057
MTSHDPGAHDGRNGDPGPGHDRERDRERDLDGVREPEQPGGLEAELIALGALLDVPAPPPPDLAAEVRARLQRTDPQGNRPPTDPQGNRRPTAPQGNRRPTHPRGNRPVTDPRGSRPPTRRSRGSRRWKVVAGVVAVVVAVTAATPQGRAAVAGILRLAGVEIHLDEEAPAPLPGAAPLPGERAVPLGDLARHVRFPVRTPSALGPPSAATVSDAGRVASLFWPDGVRLDQFDGGLDPAFFKRVGPPWPQEARVGGLPGWWVQGTHRLGYITRPDGTEVPLRQAGPTLVWQRDGVGHRLEGVPTLGRAVAIADSLK